MSNDHSYNIDKIVFSDSSTGSDAKDGQIFG